MARVSLLQSRYTSLLNYHVQNFSVWYNGLHSTPLLPLPTSWSKNIIGALAPAPYILLLYLNTLKGNLPALGANKMLVKALA